MVSLLDGQSYTPALHTVSYKRRQQDKASASPEDASARQEEHHRLGWKYQHSFSEEELGSS
jgi:hypothetical protein